MKCLLIASESAEVLFYWTDPEFRQNVQDQYGASQEEGQRPPAFEDSLNTLFAPIIISCSTMVDRLGDSYACFTTENQHNYVLHQFDECLYIAVNGDGQECEDDLRRKIYVMKKMIEVLFGMVNLSSNLLRKELRPQDTEQRTGLWKHLQGLLETYSRLRENDQSFLVEAVERLIHPTLCEQCIEFLERRLLPALNSSSERNGEEVLHSFILVHTKLLAFYSSRNTSTLSPSDLLALIVMTQSMYPSNTDQEDHGPEDVESVSVSGLEMFYTPQPSPTNRSSSGSERTAREDTPMFEFVDPDIQIAEDSLITLEVSPPDPLAPTRVFLEVSLKDGLYPMMPHSMYCRPLWPGITLVLLTKIPNSSVAMSVYSYLEAFAKLEKRLSEGQEGPAAARGQPTVHDLRSKLDKFIKALGPCDIQVLYSDIQVPYSDIEVPYSDIQVPYSDIQVPYSDIQVPYTSRYRTATSRYRTHPGTVQRHPGTVQRHPGTVQRHPGTVLRAHGYRTATSRYRTATSRYRTATSRYRTAKSRYRTATSRYRTPTFRYCTHSGTVHIQVPYTSRYRTHSGTVHIQVPYTFRYRTHPGTVHIQVPYTSRYRTHSGTVHIQVPYTSRYRTHSGTVHIQVPYTSRYCTHSGTVHIQVPYTFRYCTHSGTVHIQVPYTSRYCTHSGTVHIQAPYSDIQVP
ncbi:Hermansky-Pudlak syndrome 1 protein isoform X1 [Gadus chalcogrammus]|uniref:Hermansky-Pudlak syndrome 1 protein isoform X1 n=1 Tax=Gadus chalcogrammus TaxID=1042646 RepID=UPI0024C4C14F|nr:Hermansky-Pudlak syndrome 1 protein isoform X1 [Gadus chalcogrammus]